MATDLSDEWNVILPFDAWTLACLLCGRFDNGELQAVSLPFQPIARRLASFSPLDRSKQWEAFIYGRNDWKEIIWAVAAADPCSPPPPS